MLTLQNRYYSVVYYACSIINKKCHYLELSQTNAISLRKVHVVFLLKSKHFHALNRKNTPSKKSRVPNQQFGFSMIELLIAMLIFSIGLLGMASLQVTGMRMTRDSELNERASLYVNSMADKIRANSSSFVDTTAWNKTIQTALPDGFGEVTSNNRTHTISVSWVESQDSALQNSARKYELVIQL